MAQTGVNRTGAEIKPTYVRIQLSCLSEGFSEQQRRVFKWYDIQAFFKPIKTLSQLLFGPMDKLDNEKVVGPVYHIHFEDCEAAYMLERLSVH